MKERRRGERGKKEIEEEGFISFFLYSIFFLFLLFWNFFVQLIS